MDIMFLVTLSISLIVECYTSRILAIFPTPCISHQVVFRPLTQELAKRGHVVTVITTDPAFAKGDGPENLIEIDVHDISYKNWSAQFLYKHEFGKRSSAYTILKSVVDDTMMPLTEVQINADEVQYLINEAEFDLLLIEAWMRHTLVYTHIFKAPVIQISSFGPMLDNDVTMGFPLHPFLYPMPFQQKLYNLTFFDKIDLLYNYWLFKSMWFSKENEDIKSFREMFGTDFPPYNELRNNVDMLFLNMHPMWLHNQPVPPNVISIWGIYAQPEKVLPQDLQIYMDSSKHGVIYISFGTNAPSSSLPSKFIQLLIGIFSKLPYDVLWKWEKDELPGKSANIRISKWLPQADLLRHPNLKLFITHGGLQSTEEAISTGVPLIGIPMFADQWYNAEKYVHFNIGKILDMETINEDNLKSAIQTLIDNKSYRDNMIKLHTLFEDEPKIGLERAVWWTEYVMRHGGAKQLRTAAANMPWTEYYEIKLIIGLLIILAVVIITLLIVIYLVIKRLLFKYLK